MRAGYCWIQKDPKTFPDYGPGKCLYCGKDLPPRKRKYCCDSHGYKYRYDTALQVFTTWAEFRDIIFERDNHVCFDCGGKADIVHHKTPIYKEGLEFDKSNCISLCENCHKIRHHKRGSLIELGKQKQLKIVP